MAETSGSCGIVSRRNPGIIRPQTEPRLLDRVKQDYEKLKTARMLNEYARIMEKPASERTFSEKMFVAQLNAQNAMNFIEDVFGPGIKYMA